MTVRPLHTRIDVRPLLARSEVQTQYLSLKHPLHATFGFLIVSTITTLFSSTFTHSHANSNTSNLKLHEKERNRKKDLRCLTGCPSSEPSAPMLAPCLPLQSPSVCLRSWRNCFLRQRVLASKAREKISPRNYEAARRMGRRRLAATTRIAREDFAQRSLLF